MREGKTAACSWYGTDSVLTNNNAEPIRYETNTNKSHPTYDKYNEKEDKYEEGKQFLKYVFHFAEGKIHIASHKISYSVFHFQLLPTSTWILHFKHTRLDNWIFSLLTLQTDQNCFLFVGCFLCLSLNDFPDQSCRPTLLLPACFLLLCLLSFFHT